MLTKSKENGVVDVGQPGGLTEVDFKEIGFNIKENVEGIEFNIPSIQIIHQAQAFKLPDSSTRNTIEGIILHHHRVNEYWGANSSSGGYSPFCYSNEASVPSSENPISDNCENCEKNKFGSDGAKGKACKNKRIIYLIPHIDSIPYKITISATSFKNWKEYAFRLTQKERPIPTVVTKIGLVKTERKDKAIYSKVTFEMVKEINDHNILRNLAKQKEILKANLKDQKISVEEVISISSDADPF